MADRRARAGGKEQRVAAYKRLLQAYLDRRPSGMRLKIAKAIGKHKSFVSQISNPAYPIPVPARHLETIFEICHFSTEEREAFLEAYAAAHPNQSKGLAPPARERAKRTLEIELPDFADPKTERQVEAAITDFARRLIEIARKA